MAKSKSLVLKGQKPFVWYLPAKQKILSLRPLRLCGEFLFFSLKESFQAGLAAEVVVLPCDTASYG